MSLIEEWTHDGQVPLDTDAAFRIVFVALCIVAASIRDARFLFWNALFVLAGFLAYVSALFLQLR